MEFKTLIYFPRCFELWIRICESSTFSTLRLENCSFCRAGIAIVENINVKNS